MVQPEQAKAQLDKAREKVWSTVQKIVSILEQDIRIYVTDAVKNVFMNNFDRVQTMSREEVVQLRRRQKQLQKTPKTG